MEEHICKFCGKKFKTGPLLGTHISKQCEFNPNRGKQKNSKIWICSICNEKFSSRKLLQKHRKEIHKIEPTNKFYGYHQDINKPCKFCGKIFKKQANLTFHEKHCVENPERIPYKKNYICSDETRKKLSDIAIKNLQGSHTNWLNKKKSYAEEYFDNIFVDAEKQFKVGRYFLDYAWPDKKFYIEVDGEQHYTEQGIQHDEIRTAYLKSIGWTCKGRIRWAEYQKLSFKEKQNLIKNIIAGWTGGGSSSVS